MVCLKVLTVHQKRYTSAEISMRPIAAKLYGGWVRGREKCTLWEGRRIASERLLFKLVFDYK